VDETGIANPGWLAPGALGLQCLPLGTLRAGAPPARSAAKGYGG